MTLQTKRWQTVVRAILAPVVGYAAIAALTTLGLEGWLDGVNLWTAGPAVLAQATAITVAAGLTGGWLAGRLGGRRPLLHAASVLLLLALDGSYVLFVLPLRAPWWFELGGLLTLMGSTLAGGWLATRWPRRSAPAPAAPPPRAAGAG